MIAQEVREYLSVLGFNSLDEIIGRSDLLSKNRAIEFWKARGLDFSTIFAQVKSKKQRKVRCTEKQNHEINDVIDIDVLRQLI